jgi:hypothetical protein
MIQYLRIVRRYCNTTLTVQQARASGRIDEFAPRVSNVVTDHDKVHRAAMISSGQNPSCSHVQGREHEATMTTSIPEVRVAE